MKKREFLKDIKGKSRVDLTIQAKTLAEELMKLRFRKVTGQVDQGHRFREIRRNIARIRTAITKIDETSVKS